MGKNSKTEKRSIAATPESKIDPSLASLFDSSFGAVQAPQKPARRIARENDSDDPENVTEPPLEGSDKGFAHLQVREEKKRKRKRPDDNEDIEDFHMKRLHDSRQAAGERRKRETTETEARKGGKGEEANEEGSEEGSEREGKGGEESEGDSEEGDGDEDDEREDPPPRHEALTTSKEASELEKSARTVFLGNSYQTLKAHFRTAGKIVSIRFRSIAFSEQIPRKAAFVTHKFHEKQQTMNAYVVYSTPAEAREALKLNGSTVLDRHIRVDSVAHPAPHDSKRCIFIGNLDFEAQEENLWRHFASCGKVESVRVVRDSKTNVGKGFAYDPTSVEQALLLDGKKMENDRKLRVTRAKNLKRNQLKKPERRPDHRTRPGQKNVYVPKVDPKTRDTLSRAHKLLGRAGAAQLKSQGQAFEGLRATAQTDPGIKKGGSGKKKTGRARARAAARTAAWKQKSVKKSL